MSLVYLNLKDIRLKNISFSFWSVFPPVLITNPFLYFSNK